VSLPKPISVQTLGGLRGQPLNYESHQRTVAAINGVIASLGPGESIAPQNFGLQGFGAGATVTATSGTFKRGRLTVTIGAAPAANPVVTLTFPKNEFSVTPFAQVTRNGGTGTLGFSWTESQSALQITLAGTPVAGETYTFQYAMRD